MCSSNFPNILLINLCAFDTLFCLIVVPHHAVGYFYNGLPFSPRHCKILGFVTLFIMYGERMALAIIALNATNLIHNSFFPNSRYNPSQTRISIRNCLNIVLFRINYDFIPNPVKLILPWLMFVLLLGTILELEEQFGKFGYVPNTGQCTIITPKVFPVLELLGTYIPFLVIVFCYTKLFAPACSRSEELEKDESRR